jgi:uncharacterized membrane protein
VATIRPPAITPIIPAVVVGGKIFVSLAVLFWSFDVQNERHGGSFLTCGSDAVGILQLGGMVFWYGLAGVGFWVGGEICDRKKLFVTKNTSKIRGL